MSTDLVCCFIRCPSTVDCKQRTQIGRNGTTAVCVSYACIERVEQSRRCYQQFPVELWSCSNTWAAQIGRLPFARGADNLPSFLLLFLQPSFTRLRLLPKHIPGSTLYVLIPDAVKYIAALQHRPGVMSLLREHFQGIDPTIIYRYSRTVHHNIDVWVPMLLFLVVLQRKLEWWGRAYTALSLTL